MATRAALLTLSVAISGCATTSPPIPCPRQNVDREAWMAPVEIPQQSFLDAWLSIGEPSSSTSWRQPTPAAKD